MTAERLVIRRVKGAVPAIRIAKRLGIKRPTRDKEVRDCMDGEVVVRELVHARLLRAPKARNEHEERECDGRSTLP